MSIYDRMNKKPVELEEVTVTADAPKMEKLRMPVQFEELPYEVAPYRDASGATLLPEVATVASAPKREKLDVPEYNHNLPKSVEGYKEQPKKVTAPVEVSTTGVGRNIVDGRVARLGGSQAVESKNTTGGVAEGRATRGINTQIDETPVYVLPEVEIVAKRNDVPAGNTAETVATPATKTVTTEKMETPATKTAVVSAPEQKADNPYKYTNWWQSPEFEKSVQLSEEEMKKRHEREMKQAKWERNAGILSDIARLGTQVGANAGGAYMIDKTTPFTQHANENLRKLREKHAADIERYAQKMKEAREKDRKDANERNLAELKLKKEAENVAYQKEKDNRDFNYNKEKDDAVFAETVRAHKANEAIAKKKAETAAAKQTHDDRVQKDFETYYEIIANDPKYTVLDIYEEPKTPTYREVQSVIAKFNADKKAGKVRVEKDNKVSEKKANPMGGSGKKKNPMN